ncbi:MAG: TetR family transcriptional regulator [Solirubrobacteraceae bacterium]
MTTSTRDRLIEAVLETLRTDGFTGASARAIAARAGVNPGLIFYYFPSLDELLLAALAESSQARLERFRTVGDQVHSARELLELLRRIYREDLDSGYIRVVSEMVSGSVARPEMGRRVMGLMDPWIAMAEQAIERVLGDSPVTGLISARELAFAGVTFYLGANLVVHLGADAEAVDGLLSAAERGAALLELLGPGAPPSPD